MNTYIVQQAGLLSYIEAENATTFTNNNGGGCVEFWVDEGMVAGFWGIEMFAKVHKSIIELESKSK